MAAVAGPIAVVRVIALATVAVGAAGCAGPFAFDGTSDSVGSHANGSLRYPSVLPPQGDGYVIPPAWRERDSNFGSDELVGAIVRATRAVSRNHPRFVASVGDISRRAGGGSAEHKSHQSGRDVDIFFAAATPAGAPVQPGTAMFHFDRAGRAVRWSPAQGTAAPASPVPDVRFDTRRNWALVRALLTDPDVEVQWVFVQRDLAARLVQQGAAEGDDPGLLARATAILRQPSDAEIHDDHMHVRVYCDPADRELACTDRGPVRWWKKRWKYMEPPFGHPGTFDTASALRGLLRGRLPVVVGRSRLTS